MDLSLFQSSLFCLGIDFDEDRGVTGYKQVVNSLRAFVDLKEGQKIDDIESFPVPVFLIITILNPECANGISDKLGEGSAGKFIPYKMNYTITPPGGEFGGKKGSGSISLFNTTKSELTVTTVTKYILPYVTNGIYWIKATIEVEKFDYKESHSTPIKLSILPSDVK